MAVFSPLSQVADDDDEPDLISKEEAEENGGTFIGSDGEEYEYVTESSDHESDHASDHESDHRSPSDGDHDHL